MTTQDLDAINRKWSFYRFFNTDEQKWVWYVQWEREPCQWISGRGYTLEEAIKELEAQHNEPVE